MSTQEQIDRISDITDAILRKSNQIHSFEQAQRDWNRPGAAIYIGENTYVVLKDGSVNPAMVGVHREVLSAIDTKLQTFRIELHNLRLQLRNLVLEGGAG